jgi:hypothetical protein
MDAGKGIEYCWTPFSPQSAVTDPVRIIKATDSFLATSALEFARTRNSVRSRFLQSLGRTPNAVRDLFDLDLQMRRWQSNPGQPPFFIQLYFSLLVASATEATHDEGLYRQRLCSMLELAPGDYVNKGLPDLWREAFLHGMSQLPLDEPTDAVLHESVASLLRPMPGTAFN